MVNSMEKIEKRGKAKLDLEWMKKVFEELASVNGKLEFKAVNNERILVIEVDAIYREILETVREMEEIGIGVMEDMYAEKDRIRIVLNCFEDDIEFL